MFQSFHKLNRAMGHYELAFQMISNTAGIQSIEMSHH